MTSLQMIFTVAITLASIGLIIELSSNRRNREMSPDSGKRPSIMHRNLRLMGMFHYRSGFIYYHCFCLGPFIFAPLGCYSSTSRKSGDIISSQKMNSWEIIALYFRWGWLIALVTFLCM